ncbi:MAG TPA: SCO family protein [Acetobacteraceae bacterium]
MTRGFLPLLGLVLAAGVAGLGWGTDGFRAVTTEGARRLTIEHRRPAIPDVALIDQDGARFSPDAYRGHVLLVEFIYTDCPTICGTLGDEFRQVLDRLRHDGGGAGQADLLSISFDPAHDDPPALRAYGARFGAAAPRWRIAVPAGAAGLRALLKTFGVVVIADPLGGFIHDGAVFVVDRAGRLERILDPDAPAAVLAQAVRAVS